MEPEPATAQEAGDALQLPPIDPRQGTLLGFELPPDALALIASGQGTVEVDVETSAPAPVQKDLLPPAVQVARVPRGKPAAAEGPVVETAGSKAPAVEAVAAPKQATRTAEEAVPTPKQAAPEPKLLSPGAALASVRQQAPRRSADATRPSAAPASVGAERSVNATPAFAVSSTPDVPAVAAAQSAQGAQAAEATQAAAAAPAAPLAPAAPAADTAARSSDPALPAELAATVVSLREALAQERMAAQERWRRTRHWLGLSLGGFVLLFAVSAAQTLALIGFTHRAQAEQQKTQSALAQQQAALAGLASSTSALAALIPAPAQAASAPEASAPHEHHRVKPVHARHLKDKADKPEKTEKAKPAAR